jgi:hypothetical protein
MRAHCLDGRRSSPVFRSLPVFRSADALSQPFLVEPRAKQEDSADLAKQAGLRLRALHVRLDHITPKRFGLLYATFNATLILSSLHRTGWERQPLPKMAAPTKLTM